MTLEAGAFRTAEPRYQAPSLERVPRLYSLTLAFTGVTADDLRQEDVSLEFVNTVTGQEVEARRIASHDVGDAPSADRPTALPPAPAVEAWLAAHPHLDIHQTDTGELSAAPWRVSPSRTPRPAAGLMTCISSLAPTSSLVPASCCWCGAASPSVDLRTSR